MRNLAQSIKRFLKSEDGPTAVEYAVMLAMIFLVCLVAIESLGNNASDKFSAAADMLT